MQCFYLDHERAGIAVREKYAFSAGVRAALCAALAAGGCVPLVTCNRTELYFGGAAEEARRALSAFCDPAPFTLCGEGAERRLFLLAAGLLSMLVGEDEVLGQLRDSYEFARLRGATAGLDAAFQAALSCGKRVRAETGISSFACSVATLAANAVFSFGAKQVLMVGATGKIGGAVLKNLLSAGVLVTATARSHDFSAQAEGVLSVPYAERYACLRQADCVVCCTASPHLVLGLEGLKAAFADGKPRLLIDLAVPPDIDPRAGDLPGVRLIDIDGFRAAAAENNQKKREAAVRAAALAEECLLDYRAGEACRRLADRLAAHPDREALYRLRKCDPAAFLRAAEEYFK